MSFNRTFQRVYFFMFWTLFVCERKHKMPSLAKSSAMCESPNRFKQAMGTDGLINVDLCHKP